KARRGFFGNGDGRDSAGICHGLEKKFFRARAGVVVLRPAGDAADCNESGAAAIALVSGTAHSECASQRQSESNRNDSVRNRFTFDVRILLFVIKAVHADLSTAWTILCREWTVDIHVTTRNHGFGLLAFSVLERVSTRRSHVC